MQLKLELLVLCFSRCHLLKRLGGTVRALWRGPSKILHRQYSRVLANEGAPDGELGVTPLPMRRRAERAVMTAPVASLALGARVN
jgi:hypothetical protein